MEKGLPLTLDIFQQSLVSKLTTTSDFSSKPGTLLWTRTLGTIMSYSQKPAKATKHRASMNYIVTRAK